jgi:AraC family transcriptional regulator
MTGSWSAELLPRNPYQTAYTPEVSIIGFAFEAQVGVHAFGSDRRVAFRAKPNGLAYVPAGCDVYSTSGHGGEYLKIALAGSPSDLYKCPRRFSDLIDAIAISAAHDLRMTAIRCSAIGASRCSRNAWLGLWRRPRQPQLPG